MTNHSLCSREVPQQHDVTSCQGQQREANQHMYEFLGLLGHEIRTPLGAIRNALRVLELKGEDARSREWARGLIERQTLSITSLVEDLLEVCRIENGKIQLRKQPLDLGQSIAQAIETVRAQVEVRNHHLEVNLPVDPVLFSGDPNRLEQVFTNLLTNAVKYTEPGGRIQVTAEVAGGNVMVRIRDNGRGIAPDMLPHVFDPFWQSERAFDQPENGLGIGLALVRKLAEMHGGSAAAYSSGLGHGSEFTVCLPTLSC